MARSKELIEKRNAAMLQDFRDKYESLKHGRHSAKTNVSIGFVASKYFLTENRTFKIIRAQILKEEEEPKEKEQ